ncbi:hypothetical protein P43SY_007170 [Pythium insidiosum]|uniref:Uncharacterized protein n=1 Tax=Pythium insidiosum TaxID=114742 RepID=A0AAD5M0Q7_PYTIN|nr:hypothetical protein P43SY_007170 [Pythium insidiosum]
MVAPTARNASAMALLPPIGSSFDGSGDDDANNALYKWIGLGIVVGSAVLSNLGVNVQKLSHVREEELPMTQRRVYYTRPIWIIGMILIVLGAIGDFEALGLSWLRSAEVVPLIFWQHLTLTDILGTSLIIIGVVLSTVVNQPDAKMTLDELERQFFQPSFLVYLGVMMVILGVMFGEIQTISRLPRRHNEEKHRLLPFFYATASGIFGSFSVLLAKCASILLILTFSGENQFVYFTTYLFVGGMIMTLVLQTDLLNRAIMTGDTVSVFPMFQCFWIGKYKNFTVFEWICLPAALGLIIWGIYLLSKHGEEDLAHLMGNGQGVGASPVLARKSSHFAGGHFGALMPLSPTHRASFLLSQHSKLFDEIKDENTPLKAEKTALIEDDQEQFQAHQRIVV